MSWGTCGVEGAFGDELQAGSQAGRTRGIYQAGFLEWTAGFDTGSVCNGYDSG